MAKQNRVYAKRLDTMKRGTEIVKSLLIFKVLGANLAFSPSFVIAPHKLIKLLQTTISLIPIRPIVSYICDMCEFYMEIEQTLKCRATVTSVLQCEQQRLQLRPIDRLFNIVVHPCSQTSVHVLLSSMC